MKLSETDKKLLNVIQEDDMGVARVSKVASRVKLSTSTVKTKLNKFEKLGIIKGYSAIIDPYKVGKKLLAFKLGRKKFDKSEDLDVIGKKLASMPEVQEVYYAVGNWNYIIKFRVKDETEFTKVAPRIGIMLDVCKGLIAPRCFKEDYKIHVDSTDPDLKLKPVDKKILNIVQESDMAAPRTTKIAHKMKLPPSTVNTKIEKFKKLGIIKGFSAVIDSEKLGRSVVAFKFGAKKFKNTSDLEKIGKKLSGINKVQEVFFLVGEWDYITKMRIKDEEEYAKVAPNIAILVDRCEGMIAPKCFKESRKIIVR